MYHALQDTIVQEQIVYHAHLLVPHVLAQEFQVAQAAQEVYSYWVLFVKVTVVAWQLLEIYANIA